MISRRILGWSVSSKGRNAQGVRYHQPAVRSSDAGRGRDVAGRAGHRVLQSGRTIIGRDAGGGALCRDQGHRRGAERKPTCWHCSVPRTRSTVADPSVTTIAATSSSPATRRFATGSPGRSVSQGLIKRNPAFRRFFYREISQKLDELANDEETDVTARCSTPRSANCSCIRRCFWLPVIRSRLTPGI
uniref:Protocatechuate-3,4-dioxygenase alpha subunit n=1 Tax=Bradyrhizobium japonicum TaxID=375 RepID=Q45217_BRAJP|nr:protocatechuate-3,4-dioxygenase alpha subunit [Bradyrhizobium japonicum]